MGILDIIPTVESCCFCISLKWGSFIIAILGICAVAYDCFASFGGGGGVCLVMSGILLQILKYFSYVVLAIQIIVFLASCFLIYGVFASEPLAAQIFIYAVLASMFVLLVYFGITLTSGIMNLDVCKFPYIAVISSICRALIWIYCIMVVKSFEEEM